MRNFLFAILNSSLFDNKEERRKKRERKIRVLELELEDEERENEEREQRELKLEENLFPLTITNILKDNFFVFLKNINEYLGEWDKLHFYNIALFRESLLKAKYVFKVSVGVVREFEKRDSQLAIIDRSISEGDLSSIKYAFSLRPLWDRDMGHILFNIDLYKHLKIVKFFVEKGFRISNDYILYSYNLRNSKEIFKYLFLTFHHQISPHNLQEIFSTIIQNKDLETFKYLSSIVKDIHFDNEILLKEAIVSNNLDIVKFLAENGANLRVEKDTPLFLAVREENLPMVDFLVQHGVPIHGNEQIIFDALGSECSGKILSYLTKHGFEKECIF